MNKKQVYVHIGLPRTGTTFLQKNVFPNLNLNFCKRRVLQTLTYADDEKILISDESISVLDNRFDVLHVIKHIFGDAVGIIYCHREYDSYMNSVYRQYIKKGGTLQEHEYFKQNLSNNVYNITEFNLYKESINKLFDKTFIYDFSIFQKDAERIVQGLCAFMDVDVPSSIDYKIVNKSVDKDKVHIRRMFNKIIKLKNKVV